jgi:hypothetical protein
MSTERLGRAYPNVKVRMNVACQSERTGDIGLIVLHDTEGGNVPNSIRDLQGLGDYFDRLSTQASSHVGVDQDGNSARYVPAVRKAWTQAYWNQVSLSVEQIGFATEDWNAPAKTEEIHETARWIAMWHRYHGVPIRRGKVSAGGSVLRTGVVQHRDLGSLGGGHHDVSASYPMARVLRLARRYAVLQTARPDEAPGD